MRAGYHWTWPVTFPLDLTHAHTRLARLPKIASVCWFFVWIFMQLNPGKCNSEGKRKTVRASGEFELSGKFTWNFDQGKGNLVGVSGVFGRVMRVRVTEVLSSPLGVLGSVGPGLYRELWRHRGRITDARPKWRLLPAGCSNFSK